MYLSGIRRIVEPVLEPVTIDQVKTHMRLTTTNSDARLLTVIPQARDMLERETRRAFIEQTWNAYFDVFTLRMQIPRAPTIDVLKVEYMSVDNVLTELSTDVYGVDLNSDTSEVYLKQGQAWPTTYAGPSSVIITFTAGYGLDSSAMPPKVTQAMLLLVEHMDSAGGEELPTGIFNVIQAIKCWGVGL